MGKSVYAMVTDKIIEQLEQGHIPWKKPWTGAFKGAFNRISKKSYSLINQLMLMHSGEYATFKQWSGLGGKVKKGEKSEQVVFWKVMEVEEEKVDGTKTVKGIPILRYINVFHVSQVEGVEPLEPEKREAAEPIGEAERLLHGYWDREKIKVSIMESDRAFYSPSKDMICLPQLTQFAESNEFYSTAFHESVHSTMHEKRCNRDAGGRFGSEKYSKEELVAELGSASLMNIVGIETNSSFKNSAAYIQNWLSVLKNDVKCIVSASTKAEKAVKYILGE